MYRRYFNPFIGILLGVIFIIIMVVAFISDPSLNGSYYEITAGDRIYYTKSYDTTSNGIKFINVLNNSVVEVHGNYSIQAPKNR
jgi:hypothetical protein